MSKKSPAKTPVEKSIEITDEIVAAGMRLDSLVSTIADAAKQAHEAAVMLRKALTTIPPKLATGRWAPHVVAFLDRVFAGFEGSDAAKRNRAKRLMQIILSTTASKLGQSKDADASKKARKARKARQTIAKDDQAMSGDQAASGDQTVNDVSIEASDAIAVRVANIIETLDVLELGPISHMQRASRTGAITLIARVREELAAIRAALAHA